MAAMPEGFCCPYRGWLVPFAGSPVSVWSKSSATIPYQSARLYGSFSSARLGDFVRCDRLGARHVGRIILIGAGFVDVDNSALGNTDTTNYWLYPTGLLLRGATGYHAHPQPRGERGGVYSSRGPWPVGHRHGLAGVYTETGGRGLYYRGQRIDLPAITVGGVTMQSVTVLGSAYSDTPYPCLNTVVRYESGSTRGMLWLRRQAASNAWATVWDYPTPNLADYARGMAHFSPVGTDAVLPKGGGTLATGYYHLTADGVVSHPWCGETSGTGFRETDSLLAIRYDPDGNLSLVTGHQSSTSSETCTGSGDTLSYLLRRDTVTRIDWGDGTELSVSGFDERSQAPGGALHWTLRDDRIQILSIDPTDPGHRLVRITRQRAGELLYEWYAGTQLLHESSAPATNDYVLDSMSTCPGIDHIPGHNSSITTLTTPGALSQDDQWNTMAIVRPNTSGQWQSSLVTPVFWCNDMTEQQFLDLTGMDSLDDFPLHNQSIQAHT